MNCGNLNQNFVTRKCQNGFISILVYAILTTAGVSLVFWISGMLKLNVVRRRYKIALIVSLVYTILLTAGALLLFWITANKNGIDLLYRDRFPFTIFLVETKGSSKLNPRQACAVESAARHHPNSEIQVVMFTSQALDQFGLLHSYHNIRINSSNPESIFIDTPIWKWYQNTVWNNPFFRTYDLSDASRNSLVWKYGGVYLDLDTVMLRSLYGQRNFLIKESEMAVCAGIFGFESRHPFLTKYLEMLPKMHKKEEWGSLGPRLYTNIFTSICQQEKLSIFEGAYPQCNLTVLPPETAFPVNWVQWRDYFDETKTEEVLMKMKDSYMIHVWNKFSSKQEVSVNSGNVYEITMKENCPVVYKYLVRSTLLNASFRF